LGIGWMILVLRVFAMFSDGFSAIGLGFTVDLKS
jgi:hypothetical protein